MIKVTIYNEYVQENMDVMPDEQFPANVPDHIRQMFRENAYKIKELHNGAIHNTLRDLLLEDNEIEVRHIATLDMYDCGLTKDVLDDTDVLVWWAHVAHDRVPDEIAERVRDYVLRGMGFIALHSAHPSKPMQKILGTSGRLQWRENDFCRVWNVNPTHPIAQGLPQYFELETEEMYGEFFDIPKPDDLVFISWFAGGEVFRSGCTWNRGLGKVFYFQPGHETNPSYYNPCVRQIIRNAVKWAKPVMHIDSLECPCAWESPEAKRWNWNK